MPAVRLDKETPLYDPIGVKHNRAVLGLCHSDPQANSARNAPAPKDLSICDMSYPVTPSERSSFKTKAGKRVTPHQWAVYDFTRTIPCGKVTTYKDICLAIGEGSPRSVGAALRNNPFAPYVPCHRIIASNLFIGGFFGEWGTSSKTGTQCNRKMEMLALEGVVFSKDGYVIDGENVIWKG